MRARGRRPAAVAARRGHRADARDPRVRRTARAAVECESGEGVPVELHDERFTTRMAQRMEGAVSAEDSRAARAARELARLMSLSSDERARRGRGAARGRAGRRSRSRASGAVGLAFALRLAVITSAPNPRRRRPRRSTIVKCMIPEGETRAQIALIAREKGLTGSYLAASRRSPLLDPAHYGAPPARRTSKASCSPRPTNMYAGAAARAAGRRAAAGVHRTLRPAPGRPGARAAR